MPDSGVVAPTYGLCLRSASARAAYGLVPLDLYCFSGAIVKKAKEETANRLLIEGSAYQACVRVCVGEDEVRVAENISVLQTRPSK